MKSKEDLKLILPFLWILCKQIPNAKDSKGTNMMEELVEGQVVNCCQSSMLEGSCFFPFQLLPSCLPIYLNFTSLTIEFGRKSGDMWWRFNLGFPWSDLQECRKAPLDKAYSQESRTGPADIHCCPIMEKRTMGQLCLPWNWLIHLPWLVLLHSRRYFEDRSEYRAQVERKAGYEGYMHGVAWMGRP